MYGYGTLAHQYLEPNSSYFGSYKKDKWSLHFSSTFSELLRLNSHNFRIRTPNQEKFISTDIYRKSYTLHLVRMFQIHQIQPARLLFCPPKFLHDFWNISFCP